MRDQAALLGSLPGLTRASAELVVMVDLPRRGQSEPNNAPVRGVQPSVFDLRDEVRIVEGRPFTRGVREVIVGRAIPEVVGRLPPLLASERSDIIGIACAWFARASIEALESVADDAFK